MILSGPAGMGNRSESPGRAMFLKQCLHYGDLENLASPKTGAEPALHRRCTSHCLLLKLFSILEKLESDKIPAPDENIDLRV